MDTHGLGNGTGKQNQNIQQVHPLSIMKICVALQSPIFIIDTLCDGATVFLQKRHRHLSKNRQSFSGVLLFALETQSSLRNFRIPPKKGENKAAMPPF
jgi:hypothetical protein